MYVCVCKGINERQIRSAIASGMCTRKEISRSLKAGTACGKCNPEIQEMLQSCLPNLPTREEAVARAFDGSQCEKMRPLFNPAPGQEAGLQPACVAA